MFTCGLGRGGHHHVRYTQPGLDRTLEARPSSGRETGSVMIAYVYDPGLRSGSVCVYPA